MQQVDEFLEPLTEDYVTLYKENALLKSKMRVLVGKLEEYRKNEAAMKEKVANAQRTCDKMVMEAEAKCAKMLSNANAAAAAGGGTVFIIFCQIIYPDGKAVGGAGCTAIQGNAPILGEINIADIQVNLIQFFGGNQLFQLHIRRSIHCCIQRLVDLPVILVEIRSEYSIGGFPLV